MTAPTVSVVVPSYRRPEQLEACLAGLAAQHRPADQVIVVRRDTDEQTTTVLARYRSSVDEVVVGEAGVLAAMREGMAAARGDVIAFTDDDAVARPEWLGRLAAHYADRGVGGVGGRDVYHPPTRDREQPSTRVGRFDRWGRHIGNHHVGVGEIVDVMLLKGVNMSFRREALALPRDLRGAGAQVHFEVATSLWARSQGWRLRYDPQAIVDHYHGPRFDNDQRGRQDNAAVYNEAHNLVLCYATAPVVPLWRRAAYGLAVGDRATPGLARFAVAVAHRQPDVARRLLPSLRGQVSALRAARRGDFPQMVRPPGQDG